MSHRPLPAKRSFSKGNTLVEYVLIGLFLTILCIAAMQVVGTGLNTAMAKVRDDLAAHKQGAVAALLKKNSQLNGYNAALTQAQLEQLEMSLPNKLQTTGANGSTVILANQIASAAALSLSEGKIDQAQYDALMQLANQGHKMAKIEAMVESALKLANGNMDTFNTMTFVIEGKTYTASELAYSVGSLGLNPQNLGEQSILNASNASPQAEMQKFLDLYNQVTTSGALSDPVISSSVQSASTQIAMLGELTEDAIYNLNHGMATDASIEGVLAAQAANATHMASSSICVAGNFQDNGILCQP